MSHNQSKPRGSILIWTVFMSLLLATVFFFVAQRLNLNAALQRKTIERQNAELFLESYADHITSLSADELTETIIDFEGITGALTHQVNEIKGGLDVGETVEYKVKDGDAKVLWGRCEAGEIGYLFEVNPSETPSSGNCGIYDGVVISSGPVISLTSPEVPLHYKITPQNAAILYDRAWHLSLEYPMNGQQTLKLERDFIPEGV